MSHTTPEPAPRRGWFARHKVSTAIGAFMVFVVIISAVTGGGKGGEGSGKSAKAASAPKGQKAGRQAEAKAAKEPADKSVGKSQAGRFKDFVAKNGTPTERAAVKHVTKVQGADEQNDVLDSAEVWTDYTGGLVGPHASDGKLIASAFADWKDSDNGLVTVYDAGGEILSNGNF